MLWCAAAPERSGSRREGGSSAYLDLGASVNAIKREELANMIVFAVDPGEGDSGEQGCYDF